MAVSSYSPCSQLIVRDLYSVSFSDGHTVEGYRSGLLSLQKRGCLKDRSAKVGDIEKVSKKWDRWGLQGHMAHSSGVRGFVVTLGSPLRIAQQVSSSIPVATLEWY